MNHNLSHSFHLQYANPYGGGYPGMPGGVNPETQRMFDLVDKDRSGKINAQELKAALINGKGENFSDTACNLMIGMFDTDRSGTIDVTEFEKLFQYINQWLQGEFTASLHFLSTKVFLFQFSNHTIKTKVVTLTKVNCSKLLLRWVSGSHLNLSTFW